MEFQEVVETIRAEEASVQRLFNSKTDGRGVRQNRRRDPQYLKRLAEAARLIADVRIGRQPAYLLREVMTTSDFPQLFGDILDRQLLGSYREAPYSWNLIARRGLVADFRTARRYILDGAEGVLPEVAEQEEYSETHLTDNYYEYVVKKYGRKMAFSWEALLNDDLNALTDVPERMGRSARRSEERFVTTLFADANGPHASLYTSGNANIVNTANGAAANNPPLSITALQDAFTVLSKQTDTEDEPIAFDMVTLVVPPALKVTALNLLNALQIEVQTPDAGEPNGGGRDSQRLIAQNWMKNNLQLAVNHYLPLIATTNGDTSWFLFASPAEGRPAIEIGFLRGHEEPEVFIKSSNAMRVGGGLSDPLDGDFDTDSVQYKVRHVFGGARMDPKMTVASNGSGS